jgi:hypothetical protein
MASMTHPICRFRAELTVRTYRLMLSLRTDSGRS